MVAFLIFVFVAAVCLIIVLGNKKQNNDTELTPWETAVFGDDACGKARANDYRCRGIDDDSPGFL